MCNSSEHEPYFFSYPSTQFASYSLIKFINQKHSCTCENGKIFYNSSKNLWNETWTNFFYQMDFSWYFVSCVMMFMFLYIFILFFIFWIKLFISHLCFVVFRAFNDFWTEIYEKLTILKNNIKIWNFVSWRKCKKSRRMIKSYKLWYSASSPHLR